jgi:putative ABC transport system permease protein
MSVVADIRLAARLLVKDRWFTCAAATALALGIAATTAMFSIVDGIMLRPLPFEGADRTVLLMTTNTTPTARSRNEILSYQEFLDWQAGARTLEQVGGYSQTTINLADDVAAPMRLEGLFISANAFAAIGERPRLGRDFRADDDRAGAEPVVILGHGVWQSRYAAAADVIGRRVRVNGIDASVIGVMREGFAFPAKAEAWVPLSMLPADARESRTVRRVVAFGRMNPGVSAEQVHADLGAVATELSKRYPESNAGVIPRVRPFRESSMGQAMYIVFPTLMAAVFFVLLIACANVANLLLARAASRAREISVRLSMGATRWRVIRQLLVENLVLALTAGAAGLALATVATRAFSASIQGQGAPYWLTVAIDGRAFAFFAIICIATTVLVGLVPALQLSRTNILGALNELGRAHSGGRHSRRWTEGLVVLQLALTLVLLGGGGLMTRELLTQLDMDLGVDTNGLTIAQITLDPERYPTVEERGVFYRRLDERLANIPGVKSVVVSAWPRGGGLAPEVSIEGRETPAGVRPPRATYVAIGPRYFDTLETRRVRGRDFTPGERPGVAIVNERFAAIHFAGEDPIGRRVRFEATRDSAQSPWMSIVGVAPNIRQRLLEGDPGFDPIVYVPYDVVRLSFATILTRSASQDAAVAAVRDAVRNVDADLPVWEVMSVDAELARDRFEIKMLSTTLGIFALVGLSLAGVGLYGVTAYAAAQRTREIGVRVALGAATRQIIWLVSRRAACQIVAGLAIGLPGAWMIGQLLQGELDASSAAEPTAYLVVVTMLIGVALAACAIPALRATRLNPVDALRNE